MYQSFDTGQGHEDMKALRLVRLKSESDLLKNFWPYESVKGNLTCIDNTQNRKMDSISRSFHGQNSCI